MPYILITGGLKLVIISFKPYRILGLLVEDTNSGPMLLHSMFSTYIDATGRTLLGSIVLKITSAKRLSCGSAIPNSPLYPEIYCRVLCYHQSLLRHSTYYLLAARSVYV